MGSIRKCQCNCERCKYNERCGGCVTCEANLRCSNCKTCFYTCKNRPNASTYFDSLGEISLYPNPKYKLPYFIPTLPSRLLNPAYEIHQMPYVAVHGIKYVTDNGISIAPIYQKGISSALNIKPETIPILHFYMQDKQLEKWWSNSDKENFYNITKNLGFYFVIAPNFSVYEDSPRFEHLLNIKRSMLIYNDLIKNDIPAVPDISWATINDLDFWIKQINESNIKTISFSFQMVGRQKSSNAWKDYMIGLRYLCENIPEDVTIIGVGISSKQRVKLFVQEIGNRDFCVISSFAYFRSRSGTKYDSPAYVDLPFDDLFFLNIKMASDVYKELDEERKPKF